PPKCRHRGGRAPLTFGLERRLMVECGTDAHGRVWPGPRPTFDGVRRGIPVIGTPSDGGPIRPAQGRRHPRNLESCDPGLAMRRILIVTVVLAAVAAGVLLITRDG